MKVLITGVADFGESNLAVKLLEVGEQDTTPGGMVKALSQKEKLIFQDLTPNFRYTALSCSMQAAS